MADLTKEYFDKTIKDLTAHTDKKTNSLKIYLETHIEEKIDELAIAVNKGFEDVIKRLDVRERLEELERKMGKMEKALNLRL